MVRDGKDLLVGNIFDGFFKAVTGEPGIYSMPDGDGGSLDVRGVMRIKNFDFVSRYWGHEVLSLSEAAANGGTPAGTMNMVFKKGNPVIRFLQLVAALPSLAGSGVYGIMFQLIAVFDAIETTTAALQRSAKSLAWADGKDPLVIDLDGDGIETVAKEDGRVYFDLDQDLFAEHSSWVAGDDGFLVRDRNGNGRIDDIGEMFGGRFEGGFADLATEDSDGDGRITAADAVWAALRVWRDVNQDGITDEGELKSLDELGIVSLDLAHDPLDTHLPQDVTLTGRSTVAFADGHTTRMFEVVLGADDIDTRYAGESGQPEWQQGLALNSKGFGTVTDLAVAMANDIGFGELVRSRAAAMTAPKLKTLVAQVGDVLGAWGQTLDQTRELAPHI